MAEQRLIDAKALQGKICGARCGCNYEECGSDGVCEFARYISKAPTVDAVPVDEIRVDFERLCLENQEAVLNVSICGKPNEVKLPFCKEVAEVVHGRWKYGTRAAVCSECGFERNLDDNFGAAIACPNCGSKMDGDGNG